MASVGEAETTRPLDIITGRSWDHALFTTYALSLSFYETQIHKLGLARNGCRDIRIVSDADGYQLSLSERQSHRVGNEYRLTPAALPNGVFHPKLTWLASKDIDIVLVGSGNLTFGGFGKNVECLDLIRSDQNPGAFSHVRKPIKDLETFQKLVSDDPEWFSPWNLCSQLAESVAQGNDLLPNAFYSTRESRRSHKESP